MPINNLKLRYDGVCVYATNVVKAGTAARFILSFINIVLISIVTVFLVEHVFFAALIFFGCELFIIRYTLWNLFGEERLIINAKSLSYQQHYGFFTTSFHTIKFNKRIALLPYEKITEKDKTVVKFLFESYDENNLPEVIYHSVLNISEADFVKLVQQTDKLFMDEILISYEMPAIHLN